MNADPLAVVAEQRRRPAERGRPPWWYFVVVGVMARAQRAMRADTRAGRVRAS